MARYLATYIDDSTYYASRKKIFVGSEKNWANFYNNVPTAHKDYEFTNVIFYHKHYCKLEETKLNHNGRDVKFNACDLAVIWIKIDNCYYRCIRPSFLGFATKRSYNDEYHAVRKINGEPGYYSFHGHYLLGNLYVVDKEFYLDKKAFQKDMRHFKPEECDFTNALNEVFGYA